MKEFTSVFEKFTPAVKTSAAGGISYNNNEYTRQNEALRFNSASLIVRNKLRLCG